MTTENNIIELRHVKSVMKRTRPLSRFFPYDKKRGEFVTFWDRPAAGNDDIAYDWRL